MSVRQLPEIVLDEIVTKLQTDISQALIDVRTDRDDPSIPTPIPQNYFTSEIKDPMKTPTILVICPEVDFQKEIKGANHVNAKMKVEITVILEETKEAVLTRFAHRYASVLHTILDQWGFQDAKLKFELIIERASFSPMFEHRGDAGAFRKDFLLECTAFVYENF